MSAKEQISLTSTYDLNGLVIAADAASVSSVVTQNIVGGNFSTPSMEISSPPS